VEKRALRTSGRDPRWVPNPARQSRCARVLLAVGCHARSRLPARTLFRRQRLESDKVVLARAQLRNDGGKLAGSAKSVRAADRPRAHPALHPSARGNRRRPCVSATSVRAARLRRAESRESGAPSLLQPRRSGRDIVYNNAARFLRVAASDGRDGPRLPRPPLETTAPRN
jgi:hypothetical protein